MGSESEPPQPTMPTSERAGENSPSAPSIHSSQSKAESTFSSIQTLVRDYTERKKAKAAAKKVDYYEKKYGFVPKNAMTEAEWKRAKKNGPTVKVPSKLKVTAYHGHYW